MCTDVYRSETHTCTCTCFCKILKVASSLVLGVNLPYSVYWICIACIIHVCMCCNLLGLYCFSWARNWTHPYVYCSFKSLRLQLLWQTHLDVAWEQINGLLLVLVYMLQVKIIFRFKFFNLGWFSISWIRARRQGKLRINLG